MKLQSISVDNEPFLSPVTELDLFSVEPQFQPGVYALHRLAVGTNPDKPHPTVNTGGGRVIVSDVKHHAFLGL